MRWIMKVTRYINQHKITLPGTFCKVHDINGDDYMVIDDRDKDNITIGRLEHGEKGKAQSK